ncbi:hypothetical protein CQW23_08568 [Capsicum baccatum]|uniref:Uncharacterized protein n=1 Tax=Capsicum baccatum TaxID=33114 RepID=A0A2G2X9C6_CAPBA|nr:hypothetical protein CQW23_08568 [Capsicum baccatum]
MATGENRKTASFTSVAQVHHNDGALEFRTRRESNAYSGNVANPKNLDLVSAYEGKEINCSDNSFVQLEFLHLAKLLSLQRRHLAATGMPSIKGFGMLACSKLQEIPQRMKHVARLETMKMEIEARNRFPASPYISTRVWFPRLEPVTSWSYDNNFTSYSKAYLRDVSLKRNLNDWEVQRLTELLKILESF